MIVIDTDVISELLKSTPTASVEAWLAAQPSASIFTTTITKAEIFYGLCLLPDGKRRHDLEAAIGPIFAVDLQGRVLPFDSEAADVYAELVALVGKCGDP